MAKPKIKKEPDALPERPPPMPRRASSVISISSNDDTPQASAPSVAQPVASAVIYATPQVNTSSSTEPAVRSASSASSATLAATNGDVDMEDHNENRSGEVLENLGKHGRIFIEVMQRIEQLGIAAILPSLAKLIVIGDQSAGKSSVIEAICDILLPRSEGTCTRCPFLITTTAAQRGEPWSCQIDVHKKYAYTPGSADDGPEDFENWTALRDMVVQPFDTISNKEDLDIALRRAQLAVLSPGKNPKDFVKVPTTPGLKPPVQEDFSPNIISLKITGDNLPELSLYDLPGAINSLSNDKQQYLVPFIEKLMKTYIHDPKAIILLACPATQDVETSTALRYLRACPGARDRTIGVITKPDLAESTRADYIRSIVDGSQFRMGYGWYVTRQLSQSELNQRLSYNEARKIEASFFAEAPWNSLLGPFANRFGIPNLQTELSTKLTREIVHVIPTIRANVNGRIWEVSQRLQQFPAQAVAPVQTVFEEADKVARALRECLHADSNETFRRSYRKAIKKFSQQIKDSKPKVDFRTPGYTAPRIALDDSDEEMDETPSKSQKTSRSTPAPARTPASGSRRRRTPAPVATNAAANTEKVLLRLDEVKAKYDLAAGAVLAGSLDKKITDQLMMSTMTIWRTMVPDFLRTLQTMVENLLQETIGVVLAHRRTQGIFGRILEISKALLLRLMAEERAHVERTVGAEQTRPIALGDQLKEKKIFYEVEIKKRRNIQRIREHFETLEEEGCSVPKISDQDKKAADTTWVTSTLGPDLYERELGSEAIPAVLAYYDITATSFVDALAKSIEYMLFSPYDARIHSELVQGLGINDADHCAGLLTEHPQREIERNALVQEQGRLQQALVELDNLPDLHI